MNTTTKHTPGPWEGTPQAKGRDYAITLNVNRKEVGFAVMWGNESPEAAQARIALIAAAPTMLDVLREALRCVTPLLEEPGEFPRDTCPADLFHILNEAIAKAEGRS